MLTSVYLQAIIMIKSWSHKGLKKFFEIGDKSGIQPKHAVNLKLILLQLASSLSPEDMDTPGNDFHKLSGDLKNFYSVKVNKNWRIIFAFDNGHAILVNYIDYH